jgi:hypothetical protein
MMPQVASATIRRSRKVRFTYLTDCTDPYLFPTDDLLDLIHVLTLLVILVMLTIGLASTSVNEEAKVPTAASPTPTLPPSGLTAGSAIRVEALEDITGFETSTNNKSQ